MNSGIFGKRPVGADIPLAISERITGATHIVNRLSMLLEIALDGGGIGVSKGEPRPPAITPVSFAAVDDEGVMNRQVTDLQLERHGRGFHDRRNLYPDPKQVIAICRNHLELRVAILGTGNHLHTAVGEI